MKKLFSILMMSAAVGGLFTTQSCNGTSGESHATSINLPDSANVGVSVPVFEGSLAEYLSIDTLPYVMNLKDSISTLNVHFKVIKVKPTSGMVEYGVPADSLSLSLVDADGKVIEGFTMRVDSAQVKLLQNMLTSSLNAPVELTFRSVPMSVEQKDSLAAVARNFKIRGALAINADEKSIDSMIASIRSNAAAARSAYNRFGTLCTMNMGEVYSYQNRARGIASQLVPLMPYMTPQQQQNYKSAKASIPNY